jgi:hypothetical protein
MSYQIEFEKEAKPGWSKKQKRCYHRLNSILIFWQAFDYQILRVDLTSSKESKLEDIRKNHRALRRKIEREFGFEAIEDFVVETSEGVGAVLHCVWAWKPKEETEDVSFYIPYEWLSKEWLRIHKAWSVSIKRYEKESAFTRRRVSRYVVSQYVSGQSGFVRYSYSWKRTFGFSLVKFWNAFKDYWLNYAGTDYKEMIWLWEMFLKGERLPDIVKGKGNWFITIKQMRNV